MSCASFLNQEQKTWTGEWENGKKTHSRIPPLQVLKHTKSFWRPLIAIIILRSEHQILQIYLCVIYF